MFFMTSEPKPAFDLCKTKLHRYELCSSRKMHICLAMASTFMRHHCSEIRYHPAWWACHTLAHSSREPGAKCRREQMKTTVEGHSHWHSETHHTSWQETIRASCISASSSALSAHAVASTVACHRCMTRSTPCHEEQHKHLCVKETVAPFASHACTLCRRVHIPDGTTY